MSSVVEEASLQPAATTWLSVLGFRWCRWCPDEGESGYEAPNRVLLVLAMKRFLQENSIEIGLKREALLDWGLNEGFICLRRGHDWAEPYRSEVMGVRKHEYISSPNP